MGGIGPRYSLFFVMAMILNSSFSILLSDLCTPQDGLEESQWVNWTIRLDYCCRPKEVSASLICFECRGLTSTSVFCTVAEQLFDWFWMSYMNSIRSLVHLSTNRSEIKKRESTETWSSPLVSAEHALWLLRQADSQAAEAQWDDAESMASQGVELIKWGISPPPLLLLRSFSFFFFSRLYPPVVVLCWFILTYPNYRATSPTTKGLGNN